MSNSNSPSNTAQLYPANFDSSEFNKYKNNEFNRLGEDACYNNQKNLSNNKKLKFMTTNHIDLLEAKEKLNFFGIGVRDQLFVPTDRIDNYSNLLNGTDGQILTQCNVRNGFGQLPLPTAPFRGQLQHGDVVKEDAIRNNIEVKKHSCLPIDSQFQNRHFAIFDDSQKIYTPNAMQSVETPQSGFTLGRNGMSTRFEAKFSSKNVKK